MPRNADYSCREKADKEAKRKLRWAAAEQERSKQLLGVEKEQKELADRIEAAEAEIKALQLDMEPLNEQKAKLVAQLKQVSSRITKNNDHRAERITSSIVIRRLIQENVKGSFL